MSSEGVDLPTVDKKRVKFPETPDSWEEKNSLAVAMANEVC
jgi:hypothetical protein